MTKNAKANPQNSHFGGQAQEYKSLLAGIKKQQTELMAEQRRFKTDCLDLARRALAERNDSGWDALTKLITLLESL